MKFINWERKGNFNTGCHSYQCTVQTCI